MKEKSFVGSWIRQTTRGKTRYYSVIDAIAGVTGSMNPRDYWYRIKKRQMEQGGLQLSTLCRQLRLKAPDGKYYLTDCADQEGMRLILRHLPAKVSVPLLLRKTFTLEDLQKHLLKKKVAEERESSTASCRHKHAENRLKSHTPNRRHIGRSVDAFTSLRISRPKNSIRRHRHS